MAGNDPFRGIKLSEQAPARGLEQRLFSRSTENAAPEPEKPAEKPPASANPPTPRRGPAKPAPAPKVSLKPASLASSSFSLDDEALYKASYVFTPQELEALEDLKLELNGDDHDVGAAGTTAGRRRVVGVGKLRAVRRQRDVEHELALANR